MTTYEYPQEWWEWMTWLSSGLHGRCRWRLPFLLGGILFAAVGSKVPAVAARLLLLLLKRLPRGNRILLAMDDTPTKRYGPQVQGASAMHCSKPGYRALIAIEHACGSGC